MDPERRITNALDALLKRYPDCRQPAAGAPVFVLASGWRSGSTLVQRLLASSRQILMWGEPYDKSALIHRMAESIIPFDDKWPPDPFIVSPKRMPTSDRWIANAYPSPDNLLAAHRAFFDRLFAGPARELGFTRWGVKWVRLSGEHAIYLRVLYPDARFVLVHRNPYDAFLSYRLLHDVRPKSDWWWYEWPDDQVSTAARFSEIWTNLTVSFLDWATDLDAIVVAYEELSDGDTVDRIEKALDLRLNAEVLDQRIGSIADQKGEWEGVRVSLSNDELDAIRETTGDVARRLGYSGPTTPSH